METTTTLYQIRRRSDGILYQEYGLHDRKCGFPKRAKGRILVMPKAFCDKFFPSDLFEVTPVKE